MVRVSSINLRYPYDDSNLNNVEVKVKLAWDGTPYYNDLKLTVKVPATAYSSSAGVGSLSADVKLAGTVTPTLATMIPGTINSGDYYQFSGVNFTDGWKFTDIGAGDWVDFKIDVPEAGQYTFTSML